MHVLSLSITIRVREDGEVLIFVTYSHKIHGIISSMALFRAIHSAVNMEALLLIFLLMWVLT